MLLKKSKNIFLHIDCDSFFASCEILKNPQLKDKYICIGNEIVTTCTYNCRTLGIKTGTPIWEAKKILGENGIFIAGDHFFYETISEKLIEYLKFRTLNVEPFSIDEAFCEITGLPELYKITLEKFLKNLQKDILKNIGIPVTIGCANTRIKAKIFSKINKPYGIFIGLDKDREIALFKELNVSKIPFIGKNYTKKFATNCTIYDFMQFGFWKLKDLIGKNATDLRLELNGVNAFMVRKSHKVNSFSRSRSFNNKINSNKIFLLGEAKKHFEILFEKIMKNNFEIKGIAIFFRTKEFQVLNFKRNFSEYTNNRNFIFKNMIDLFENNFDQNLLYRSVGVVFYDFKYCLPMQLNLFENNLRGKENNYILYKTIEKINEKYDERKIYFGFNLIGSNPQKEKSTYIRKI